MRNASPTITSNEEGLCDKDRIIHLNLHLAHSSPRTLLRFHSSLVLPLLPIHHELALTVRW